MKINFVFLFVFASVLFNSTVQADVNPLWPSSVMRICYASKVDAVHPPVTFTVTCRADFLTANVAAHGEYFRGRLVNSTLLGVEPIGQNGRTWAVEADCDRLVQANYDITAICGSN
jgi:hypothetical protein